MPIYAYRCSACGHAKDVLQKLSDPTLSTCPACGAETFSKQVTAAGFQLKGSGWYATDFRNGGTAASTAAGATASTSTAAPATPSDGGSSGSGGSSDSGSSPAAAAGGTSCGGSCACH